MLVKPYNFPQSELPDLGPGPDYPHVPVELWTATGSKVPLPTGWVRKRLDFGDYQLSATLQDRRSYSKTYLLTLDGGRLPVTQDDIDEMACLIDCREPGQTAGATLERNEDGTYTLDIP